MRFRQLDRIVEIEPGVRIVATKRLSPTEQYLEDHFPRFPVMPGVLMLEAMFQASVWLIYHTENFAHSMIVLKEARNVKFSDFVKPNETLTVTAELIGHTGPFVRIKAQGTLGESVAVSGRLVLEPFNWSERYPPKAPIDQHLRHEMRQQFGHLMSQAHVAATAGQGPG